MLSDTSHTLDVNRNINRKVSLYEKSHMRSEESEKAFFDNLLLVDHDLSLTFAGKEGVTPPDTDVVAYHFTMNHACTGEENGPNQYKGRVYGKHHPLQGQHRVYRI